MNLGDIQARVADMLARTDLDTQIAAEIGLAVTKYRRRVTWLSEVRDATITTAAGTGWYSTFDMTAASALQQVTRAAEPVSSILSVQYMSLSGAEPEMCEMPFAELKRLQQSGASGGKPYRYALHAGSIGFWATPDAAYTVQFSAVVKPLVPTGAGDTSVFFDEAQELIESAAAEGVSRKFVKDYEQAATFLAAEQRAYGDLVGEGALKMGTGRLAARF